MQENVQNEESGISLIEILRLLLSKIKLLILVVIAAAIAGGSYAFFTSRNDVHYGTRVEFYVNPEKPKTSTDDSSNFSVYGAYGRHVMDNMVRLLKSEKFAEKLLLNGDKLPKLKYIAGETTPFGLVVPQEKSWSWFTTDESKEAFNKALENLNKATAENATAEEVEKAEEEVFRIWRATPTYKRVLKSYAASVNYSYLDEKVEIEEANNLARSFIYVDISVTGEENETNESYNSRLFARGVERLLENKQTFSCAFTPYSNDFGTKYDLGDMVDIVLNEYGIKLQARISRFTQKQQRNQLKTVVEIGNITIR